MSTIDITRVDMAKKVSLAKRSTLSDPRREIFERLDVIFAETWSEYDAWMYADTITEGLAENDMEALAWAFRKLCK